ncbi:hypothetical protein Pcac1_g29201 [Phytophthora cactorum]|nr:hypothetical protein Pcac1_g29201 [Phytophthora cactorum]
MKMSTTWTSNRSTIDNDGSRRRSNTQAGKRKSRPSDEDEAARRPRAVRHRPGLEEASAPNYSSSASEQTQTKKKSMEMKMTIRLHQFFGVQVPMPSKQAIYRSRRHSKKR